MGDTGEDVPNRHSSVSRPSFAILPQVFGEIGLELIFPAKILEEIRQVRRLTDTNKVSVIVDQRCVSRHDKHEPPLQLCDLSVFLQCCTGLGRGRAPACNCATDTSAAACSILKVLTISYTWGCVYPTTFLSFECQPSRLLLVRQSPISQTFQIAGGKLPEIQVLAKQSTQQTRARLLITYECILMSIAQADVFMLEMQDAIIKCSWHTHTPFAVHSSSNLSIITVRAPVGDSARLCCCRRYGTRPEGARGRESLKVRNGLGME